MNRTTGPKKEYHFESSAWGNQHPPNSCYFHISFPTINSHWNLPGCGTPLTEELLYISVFYQPTTNLYLGKTKKKKKNKNLNLKVLRILFWKMWNLMKKHLRYIVSSYGIWHFNLNNTTLCSLFLDEGTCVHTHRTHHWCYWSLPPWSPISRGHLNGDFPQALFNGCLSRGKTRMHVNSTDVPPAITWEYPKSQTPVVVWQMLWF